MLFIQRKQLPLFEEIISTELNVTVNTEKAALDFCMFNYIGMWRFFPYTLFPLNLMATSFQFCNDAAIVAHPVDGDALYLSIYLSISLRAYYPWLALEEMN